MRTSKTIKFIDKLVIVIVVSFGLAANAFAVNPPPDGDYGNGNTAEGSSALNSLSIGTSNTALGSAALFTNTTGSDNTATGAGGFTPTAPGAVTRPPAS